LVKKITPCKELLRKWILEDEEAREIRRRYANWEFIKNQPPKVRLALTYLIESGDLYKAAKIADLTIDELNELRIKAKIPNIT